MACHLPSKRDPPALLVLITALFFWLWTVGLATAAEYDLFAPPPASEPANLEEVLRSAKVLQPNQTLADLPPPQRAAIEAIRAAHTQPSMATAVALLSHFPTFSDKDNAAFRLALAQDKTTLNVLLMADLAKYELIMKANKRIHKQEKSSGNAEGIVVSVRVGSTGLRFAQWQQWKEAGSPMDGDWVFVDPFKKDGEPGKTVSFSGMPIDDKYRDAKLLAADDDISNWTSATARAADPLANERINGKDAAAAFEAETAIELKRLPEDLRGIVKDGQTSVKSSDMMVEFLSPTQAHNIMKDEARRTAKGWETPIDLTTVHFLGAWVHADPEKYNGLFTEEQLHAWGILKGYVTENVEAPLAEGSSKTYKESATSGKLKDITGSDVFPKGVKDPFGWMATNYRQIFVTHAGDLDSLAKYTERMIDWWGSVNLSKDELRKLVGKDDLRREVVRQLAQDSPGIRAISPAEFDKLDKLAREIRNAKDADAKAAAIKGAGGKDKALALLKDLNQSMMVTGQRKHLSQLAETTTAILQEDSTSRTLQQRLDEPLQFADILAEAESRVSAGKDKDDPYVSFLISINAYANGYANLPADVAQFMAADIAHFVNNDFLKADGEGQISAEMRLQLLPVLERGAERARAVGTDTREDAEGLARFAALAKSDLGQQISKKLVDLGEPDMHGYLKKIQQGQITRRKYWLFPDEDGGWPRVMEVDQIWRPADIGNDVKRLMWLGEKLGWSDRDFAHRLAAYVNGPDYRVPSAPLPDGAEPPRSYTDTAVDAYLAFSRLGERASSTTHFVQIPDADGNMITRQFTGTNLGDQAANTLQILFEETLRGGEAATKIWGIKGDVESLTTFAGSLHSFTLGNPDQSNADRARALTTMVAEAYGLFPAMVEHFGTEKWQNELERHVGKKSAVLGKVGSTVGALLSNADSAFQTPEAQEALYGAILTDMAVAWQPHVATFMAVHAMYSAGTGLINDANATADLIMLIARNGDWKFTTDGKPPKLNSVHLGDLIILEDAAARKKQCLLRSQSSLARDGKARTTSVGIEEILRIIPSFQDTGVALCEKIEGGKCIPAKVPKSVKPRDAAFTLYKSSGLDANDPIIKPIKDSITAMVGWPYYIDGLRRIFFDDDTQWTAERLASHGIEPPTPEDASFVLRERVKVDVSASELSKRPRDKDNQWIHRGIFRSMNAGGKRMLGYMASEYWVRRQYLMECVLLDPWIAKAALQAEKEDLKDIDIGKVAVKLAGLDRRMRKLDEKVWPAFARSYQPYPMTLDGAPYPADQKLAIYADYLKTSADPRRELRDLIKWFEGPQTNDNIPKGPLSRAFDRQGATSALSTLQSSEEAGDKDAQNLKAAQIMLQQRVENMLSDITELVVKYEDGFDNVFKKVAATEKYVAAADGYKIAPVHVAIMGVGTFTPPNGKFGPVEDHLFPSGEWQTSGRFRLENDLLNSLHFDGLKPVIDGTVGAALREWDYGYQQVKADAQQGVADQIEPFQTTLVKEKQGKLLHIPPLYSDKTLRFEVMTGLPTSDLAADHPLFNRILRQAFQAHKASLVAAQPDRVEEAEFKAVVKEMKIDGPKGEIPKASVMGDLEAWASLFAYKAADLIAMTGDLFEITITESPADQNFVGTSLSRDFTATPYTGDQVPEITPDDLKKWINRVYWEVARNPEFNDPVQRITLDPDAAIAFPDTLLPPDATNPVIPPLMTCAAGITDRDYETRVAVLPGDDKHSLKLPLVTPGVFYMRAVAVGKRDVPLARKDLKFEVAPAELRGALKITGGTIDSSKGQRVEVHVGGLPWRKMIAKDPAPGPGPTKHPVLNLHSDGLFRAQLCGALSQIMLNTEVVPPTLVSANEAARNLETLGIFYPYPGAPSDDQIDSDTIGSDAMEPGVFGLKETIEIVMKAATAVAVTVRPVDAADKEITTDQSEIILARETHPGPGPVSLDLKEEDVLTATAELTIRGGGTVTGTSKPVTFSVKDHSAGLAIDVPLPAYGRGNLRVTGRFILPRGMEQFGGIGSGTIWSNLLGLAGYELLGSRFGFDNADPVALSDGMSFEALLHANDEIESYLTAIAPPMPTLPRGGSIDLGELEVEVLRPKTFKLTVKLSDMTGRDITLLHNARVTLDGTPMEIEGNTFTTRTSFRGRKQRREIEVAYTTPGGETRKTYEITASLIDNPLHPKDPDTQQLTVPVYEPGNLLLIGQSEFAETEFSSKHPDADMGTGFQSQPVIDEWNDQANRSFAYELTYPVAAGARLQVTGTTRIGRHSFKGFVTAQAPWITIGWPAQVDMGTLLFEQFLDLIPMPSLVGMDIEEAKAQFGKDFEFQVHRVEDAPSDQDIDKIHVQAPLPNLPDKPSLVPRGITISLAVYKKPEGGKILVPPVTNMDLRTAQSLLARTHPDLKAHVVPGRGTLDGEAPDLVLTQDPPPGAEIDPQTQRVTLVITTLVTARVEPDEEEKEEPPPKEEPEEPAVTQPEPEDDEGPGALEVLRDLVSGLDRQWKQGSDEDTVLVVNNPTGNYQRATVSFEVTSFGRTNDVPSSKEELAVVISLQKLETIEAAQPKPRAGEERAEEFAGTDFPILAKTDSPEDGTARFSIGKFQFEIAARQTNFTILNENGESDRGFPTSGFLVVILGNYIPKSHID